MSLVNNIENAYSLPGPHPVPANRPIPQQTAHRLRETDTVELSATGRSMAQAVEESTFRLARVRAIRAGIQDGSYVTPERIEHTVARLLDVLA